MSSVSRAPRRAAFVLVFSWFAIGGVFHFAATNLEISIVPPYVPWPRATVLVSGVFELLGAAGMLIPRVRRAAGIGLCLLTLAVTPANVYMLQSSARFEIAPWVLEMRLIFQGLLLLLILWSTWPCARLWRRRPRRTA
jgi:uncharacterized membrane protein